jgi:hypothetical protein
MLLFIKAIATQTELNQPPFQAIRYIPGFATESAYVDLGVAE